MPRRDGTGPIGMGPLTGRGLGYCSAFRFPNKWWIHKGFQIWSYLYALCLITACLFMMSRIFVLIKDD